MTAPVIEADAGSFASRLGALLAAMPNARDDTFDATALTAMTRAGSPGADSLQQLVMDVHKARSRRRNCFRARFQPIRKTRREPRYSR